MSNLMKKITINPKDKNSTIVKKYRDALNEYGVKLSWKEALKTGRDELKKQLNDKQQNERITRKKEAKKQKKEKFNEKRQRILQKNIQKLKDYISVENIGKILLINNKHYYTLTDENVDNILDIIKNGKIKNYDESVQNHGSDVEIHTNITIEEINTIEFLEPKTNQKVKKTGAFFPYHHNLAFDLKRYAIFRDNKEADYSHNCLYVAFEAGGMSKTKLERYEAIFKTRHVQSKDLKEVAKKLNIKVILHCYERTKDGQKLVKKTYGEADEIYEAAN